MRLRTNKAYGSAACFACECQTHMPEKAYDYWLTGQWLRSTALHCLAPCRAACVAPIAKTLQPYSSLVTTVTNSHASASSSGVTSASEGVRLSARRSHFVSPSFRFRTCRHGSSHKRPCVGRRPTLAVSASQQASKSNGTTCLAATRSSTGRSGARHSGLAPSWSAAASSPPCHVCTK